jgi:hypothetical protein
MLPTLSGAAALLFAAIAAIAAALDGQTVIAASLAIGGLVTFALLRTLSEIADHLQALRESQKQ